MGETDKHKDEGGAREFARDEAALRFPALKEAILLSSGGTSSQSASGLLNQTNPLPSLVRKKNPQKTLLGIFLPG